MTSSAKRKKEKKKDFQKPKLKVGKARPKASNFTDTSFKAKSIAVPTQSLSTSASSPSAQFAHHLSLLRHKSDTQRKESLAHLTSVVLASADGGLPQPVQVIISKVQPLVVDRSNGVREQLVKFLQSLPAPAIPGHLDQLLLYVKMGINHLSVDIRSTSFDVFDWLLRVAGADVVGATGGWVKTWRGLLAQLSWAVDEAGAGAVGTATAGKTKAETDVYVKALSVLERFLRAGFAPPPPAAAAGDEARGWFPLVHTERHLLPAPGRPARRAYADSLHLFGPLPDEDDEMYGDLEERQRIFHRRGQAAVVAGVKQAKQIGGPIGRAAAQVEKAVEDGMRDFRCYDWLLGDCRCRKAPQTYREFRAAV